MSDDKSLIKIPLEGKLEVTADVNDLAKTAVDGVEKLLTGQPGKELGRSLSYYIEVLGLTPRAIVGVYNFVAYAISKAAYAPKKAAPPRALLGQTLDGVRWNEEGSLHYEMFARLLALSMDEEKGMAHPSFAKIIESLSRDEAFIIKERYITYRKWEESMPESSLLIDGLYHREYYDMYHERLASLSLLVDTSYESSLDEAIDKKINGATSGFDGFIGLLEPNPSLNFTRSPRFCLTDFGLLFAQTCIPSGDEWTW